MSEIVFFDRISKKYNENEILNNFSLKINKGDFICVVGTSGSGKTTLMKMINGLIMPDSGEIFVNGTNIKNQDLIALRRKMGYVIQGNYLFCHMNVAQNIAYTLNLEKKPKDQIEKIVDDMLAMAHLPLDIKARYPDELSGGQQQRVGIARAYANNPDILLMDEPFGAVDAITRQQLQFDLKQIHKQTNCTIFFITHDISEAFKLGTHILVLDKGRIKRYGKSDDVYNNPDDEFVKKLIKMSKWGF